MDVKFIWKIMDCVWKQSVRYRPSDSNAIFFSTPSLNSTAYIVKLYYGKTIVTCTQRDGLTFAKCWAESWETVALQTAVRGEWISVYKHSIFVENTSGPLRTDPLHLGRSAVVGLTHAVHRLSTKDGRWRYGVHSRGNRQRTLRPTRIVDAYTSISLTDGGNGVRLDRQRGRLVKPRICWDMGRRPRRLGGRRGREGGVWRRDAAILVWTDRKVSGPGCSSGGVVLL